MGMHYLEFQPCAAVQRLMCVWVCVCAQLSDEFLDQYTTEVIDKTPFDKLPLTLLVLDMLGAKVSKQ